MLFRSVRLMGFPRLPNGRRPIYVIEQQNEALYVRLDRAADQDMPDADAALRQRTANQQAAVAVERLALRTHQAHALAPHLDAEAEAAAIESHEASDQRGVVVMPGAVDLVKSIPDGCWGVVTSGTRPLAQNRLRYCGLPVPDVLVTSDDVVNGKPDPEPYLKGAEGLGMQPADCMVIEDAPAGIQSARAGGMKVIGLASTYPVTGLAEADAVARALARISLTVDGDGLCVSVTAD